ncbi:MAG: STAS domain-containing protein [Acidothermaceae bacterium]
MYQPSNQNVFRFDLEHEESRIVVRLWGELDLANARRLREAFGALGDGAEKELLVDLSEVPFIDSTCLAVLVWAGNRCREQGRQLVLKSPTRAVVSALAASGLLRSFRYDASSLDSAKPWPTRLPAEPTRLPAESTRLPAAATPRPRMPQVAR